jgi:hypothetical protein
MIAAPDPQLRGQACFGCVTGGNSWRARWPHNQFAASFKVDKRCSSSSIHFNDENSGSCAPGSCGQKAAEPHGEWRLWPRAGLVPGASDSRMREISIRSALGIVPAGRSGNHAVPMMTNQPRSRERNQESIMPHKIRIALAVTLLALAAVSTVDTASAFPRFWPAVPFYYIPL